MTDWDDLRWVLAVARGGSFARAAAALGVEPSTVLRRIDRLERRLGVRLLDRSPAGQALTAAGEEAAALGRQLEEAVNGLERRLLGHDLRLGGTIRVTTTDTLALGLLMPHLAAFHRAYPEIEVELVLDNALLSLGRREADVAIRPTREPPPTLVGRRFAEITVAVYGARSLTAGRDRRAVDLHALPWVTTDDSLAHLALAAWFRARFPRARVRQRANSLLAMLAAVEAGVGIGALPCFLGDARPGLRRLTAPLPEIGSELWLLTHEDLRRTARVRAFLDFLGRALMADRDLLEGRRARRTRAEH